MNSQHNIKTRKIFHKIHLKQIKQSIGYKRISNLFNHETLKLKRNYFQDKICADFGCGSTGAGAFNLLKMKAKFVYLFDLNKHIIRSINTNLQRYKGKYQIDIGSLENTKYKNNYFDFILCQGVINHVNNDLKCLKEIHRTLKKNGKFHLNVAGEGGLFTDFTIKTIRPEYKKNPIVKKFINKIMYNNFDDYKIFFNKNLDKGSKKIFKFLSRFVDEDLFLTIQDRVLSPKQNTYNEKKLKKLLSRMGFKNIYRIKKKVKFKNIRRLLSPLYYNHDSEISRALYGEGDLSLVMTKK